MSREYAEWGLNRFNGQFGVQLLLQLGLDVLQGSAGGGGATATSALIMDADDVAFDTFEFYAAAVLR